MLASRSVAKSHLVAVVIHEPIYAQRLAFLPLPLVEQQVQILHDYQLHAVWTFEWELGSVAQDVADVLLEALEAEAVEAVLKPI